MKEKVIEVLEDSISVKKLIAENLADAIADAAGMLIDTHRSGGRVMLIGNGGSAADAQHLAGELVGRLMMERKALPAIALTTDTSTLTAISNDYGYEYVFSRQIEALGTAGDVLIAISTSGASLNIIKGIDTARSAGMKVIVLTGEKGKQLKHKADLVIAVPSGNTQRIQEAHITIGHIICQLVEEGLFGE